MCQQDADAEYVNREVYHKNSQLEYDANASFSAAGQSYGDRTHLDTAAEQPGRGLTKTEVQ
jgi:hypothetical protein